MAIDPELIDQLLAEHGHRPEDIAGEKGLLKQLTKALLERAMDAELTDHLGYEKHDPAGYNTGNSRNGKSRKKLKGDFGEMDVETPRDRNGTFEPKIVAKHQTRFTGFDDKILSMYARGMTTREIQAHLQEIYGVDVSPTLVSNVTEAVQDEVRAWQNRPLEPIYPILYMDALYVRMRDNGHVQNRAVYVAIGVNLEGNTEVLGLWTSPHEGAKFWPPEDIVYPNEYNFDLKQQAATLSDGTVIAELLVTGKLPVNSFIPGCPAVDIRNKVFQSPTGGQIPVGVTLRVAVCATNDKGQCSPPSAIILVLTDTSTDTHSFVLDQIQWPKFAGLTGYTVFMSTVDDLICAQTSGTLTPYGGATNYSPTSITVTGDTIGRQEGVARSTWALPDHNTGWVRVKAKKLIHGGIVGAPIDLIDQEAGNAFTAAQTVDAAQLDDWTGRTITMIGRVGSY